MLWRHVPKPENAITNPKILYIRRCSRVALFTRKARLAKMHLAMAAPLDASSNTTDP